MVNGDGGDAGKDDVMMIEASGSNGKGEGS